MSESEHDRPIVVVNLFALSPAKVGPFIPVWLKLAEWMSSQPGYRSFRLLRAVKPQSQFPLVNVAEWDNERMLAQANAHPDFRARVSAAVEQFGVTADPSNYHVVAEGHASP